MDGQWKFLGGKVSKAKIFKGKYEAKLVYFGGVGVGKKIHRGGMDVFWKSTICHSDVGTPIVSFRSHF